MRSKKAQYEKTALEITGIGETTERVIELILKDGGSARVLREQVEIWPGVAYVPRWLADKIKGST